MKGLIDQEAPSHRATAPDAPSSAEHVGLRLSSLALISQDAGFFVEWEMASADLSRGSRRAEFKAFQTRHQPRPGPPSYFVQQSVDTVASSERRFYASRTKEGGRPGPSCRETRTVEARAALRGCSCTTTAPMPERIAHGKAEAKQYQMWGERACVTRLQYPKRAARSWTGWNRSAWGIQLAPLVVGRGRMGGNESCTSLSL